MKKTITYIFLTISIVILGAGCGRKGSEAVLPELVKAESLMFARPDSALHLLQSMPMPSARRNESNHALWCLLVTQAQYKQMMHIPSDSLIRIAYDYYFPTSDARLKAMAALYMGGVNYNLGHVEEAIQYYLEAKSEMEKTDDYRLGYLVMSGLGNIYLYRDLTDYALDACKQAYDYAVKDSNERYQMGALHYIARYYCISDNFDEAIKSYQKCYDIALDLGLKDYCNIVQKEIASIYSNSNRYDESLQILKKLPLSNQVSFLLGKNYYYLGQIDSAYTYLKMALCTDNIYTRKFIYENLYKISKSTAKYGNDLCSNCDSLLFYNDSVMALDKSKEIIAYKEKYNNEKLVSEKQKVELEKANVIYGWMCTIVLMLVLAILFIIIYLRKRIAMHKKEEELTGLALLLHEKELEIDKNQSYIAELQRQYEESNKKEEDWMEQEEVMEKLKEENKQLTLEKKLLHERMASYSVSSSEVTNVKILSDKLQLLEKREQELCMQLLSQNPVLHKLHLKPVYLNEAELKKVCKVADVIFQNFTQRLVESVPSLSEHEVALCCLIKLRFSITEISILLSIASTSVSRSKLRIKNKIYSEFGETSKSKSLDIWLWEY